MANEGMWQKEKGSTSLQQMNSSEPDYYDILQVSPDAEREVIEAAYRRLARKYHPDVNDDPAAAVRMKGLNAAFEILGNPDKRAAYDLGRRASGSDRPEPNQPRSSAEANADRRPISRYPGRRIAVVALGVLIGLAIGIPTAVLTIRDAGSGGGAGALATTVNHVFLPTSPLLGTSQPTAAHASAIQATPVPTALPIGSGLGAFVEFAQAWWHHGFAVSIEGDGTASASWRTYKLCSTNDPSPACDVMTGNEITPAGLGTLLFTRMEGQTAYGQVATSNDAGVLAPGESVSLTLLPYDMALLHRVSSETKLCGPNFARLAPKSLLDSAPCGA
jgi:hypothetical protein